MNESPDHDGRIGRNGRLGQRGARRDAEAADGAVGGEPASAPDERDPVRAAELHLVDALLASLSEGAVDEREARIRRVMDAIDGDPAAPGRPTRSRRWPPLVAVAACLLAACLLFWLHFSSETRASEVLREIGRVSLEKTDRVYRFRRVVSGPGEPDRHEGRLYLRGCEGFVIVCGDVVLGRNTDEFWFVAPGGPVVVADDFAWLVGHSERERRELELLNVLSIDSRSLPLVQLSSAVELMQHDYEVTLDADTRHGKRVDVLVGTLRDKGADLPDTIRLWSDRDSRIIERAELRWGRNAGRSQASAVILELTAAGRVAADWYEHQAHHPADQRLRRISSGS